MFEVNWSGSYPNLCSGEWTIKKYGVDVSAAIPEGRRHSPMNVFNNYQEWSFNDGWEEEFTWYDDGLQINEWYKVNRHWIDIICNEWYEVEHLYTAIQSEDWRHGSCGGCI